MVTRKPSYFNTVQLNEPKGGGNISVPQGSRPTGKTPIESKLVGRTSQRGSASDKLTQLQMQQSGRKPATGTSMNQGKDFSQVGIQNAQGMMNQFLSDSSFRQQQMATPEGRSTFRQNFLTAMRGNPEGISNFFQQWNAADAQAASGGNVSTATPGYEPGVKGIQESLIRKIDRTYKPVDLAPKNQGGNQGGISKELAFALTNKGEDNNDDSRYGQRGGDARLRNPRTRDKYVSVNGNTISRDAVYGRSRSGPDRSTSALYSSFTNSYRFPGQDYGQMQPQMQTLLNSPQTGGQQTNLLNTQQTQGSITNTPWNPGVRAGRSFFVPPGTPNSGRTRRV